MNNRCQTYHIIIQSPANKIWISINYISVDFHVLISQLVNTCHYRDYDVMNTQIYFGSECVGSHVGNSADICVFLESLCRVNFSMRGQLFINLALFSVSERLDGVQTTSPCAAVRLLTLWYWWKTAGMFHVYERLKYF